MASALESGFPLKGPYWVVEIVANEIQPGSFLHARGENEAVVVFPSEDAAQAHITFLGHSQAVPAPLKTPEEFAQLLRRLQQTKTTHVALYFGAVGFPILQRLPIWTVLNQLELNIEMGLKWTM
jgi:hypothetical protein